MDFRLSDDGESIRELARRIFAGELTEVSLKELASPESWFHSKLWHALSDAELLGLAIPSEYGGASMTLLELGILLEQQGYWAAPLPTMPALVLAGLPLAEFGTEDQKHRYLRPLASGEPCVVGAFFECQAGSWFPYSIEARKDKSKWILSGSKECVSELGVSPAFLVSARVDASDCALFLVDADAEGIVRESQTGTSGEPLTHLVFDEVVVGEAALLGDVSSGRNKLRWIEQRVLACSCLLSLGIAERQVQMLSDYASKRHQFGQPIGAFQAVSHRAADAYSDLEAMRVTAWQALWKLSSGLNAWREVHIARYWAAEGSHRISAAAQHIHGGIGVDCDYPLHRYTLMAKQHELMYGGANETLERLGKEMTERAATLVL